MKGAAAIAENNADIAADAGRQSFDELVTVHRPRIFRFALACLRDRDAAETVTQDCFMRAYQAWGGFRGESSVQTWLTRIVLNLIRDATKSQRFQFWKRAHATAVLADVNGNYIPDGGSSAEDRISAKQHVAAVWKAVDHLSPSQRTVFLLHFMEEMDIAEIEAITGIANATIRVHLSRAVREIRNKLRRLK
jgi:RNA polymerase sigma-70 factor (ECF subfamily)